MFRKSPTCSNSCLVEQLNGIKDEVGVQVGIARASGDNLNGDGVGTLLESASRDDSIVHLAETTVCTTSNTSRVDLGGRSESLGEAAVDDDLGAAASKGQGGADTEGSLARDGRVQVELDGDGVVDGLEQGHGEVADGAGSNGVGQRAPAGHALVARVHAELVSSVAETLGLAVPVANAEDGSVLASGDVRVGSDGGGGGTAGRDAHALGSDLKLTLVEDHGVSAGNHERRGEVAVGSGVGPVLVVAVVPVDDALESGLDASSLAADPAARGVGGETRDGQLAEEAKVKVLLLGDAGAREGEGVRPVEALAVGLSLSVVRVHVEGESAEAAVVVGVDVAEEGTAGALLVGARGVSNHAGVDILGAVAEAVDAVVDEALR